MTLVHYIYKAYNLFTTQELFFFKSPKEKDFQNLIHDDLEYDEQEWEITKCEIIQNTKY